MSTREIATEFSKAKFFHTVDPYGPKELHQWIFPSLLRGPNLLNSTKRSVEMSKKSRSLSVWSTPLIREFLYALTENWKNEKLLQINELVGMTGIFTIFGASALLEAVFIYVALPETKDRTLQEIEDYFQVRNTNKDSGLEINFQWKNVDISWFLLKEGNVLWVMRTKESKENETLTANSA